MACDTDRLTKGWDVSPLLPLTLRDFPDSCWGRGTGYIAMNRVPNRNGYLEEGFNQAHSLGVLSIEVERVWWGKHEEAAGPEPQA